VKPIATQNGERIVAMSLMAVVTLGAFWVRDAAAAAEMAAATRERQVARLQQVRDGQRTSCGDLGAFSDLFDGQQIAWERGSVGPYLVLLSGHQGGE
jgi:hypothetical protein